MLNLNAHRALPLLSLLLAAGAGAAQAQPFQTYDPFYRSEQTERTFFSGYAVSGEVSYRTAGAVQEDGLPSFDANPLGLSFRLDYQLAPQLDLSGIIDAAGNSTRGGLNLSWVVFTYYERTEDTRFALRLAVDPSLDGRVGFPQLDLGWLSASSITPTTTSNFAFGVRRIRLGYEQWVLGEDPPPAVGSGSYILHGAGDGQNRNVDITYTRAFGWEARLMLGYDFAFDPAGSNVFFSLLGQAGNYDLLETSFIELSPRASQKSIGEPEEVTSDADYLGGVVWFRSGIEFNRPGYQILPFIGIPLYQWIPASANWPRSRQRVGVRLMLR